MSPYLHNVDQGYELYLPLLAYSLKSSVTSYFLPYFSLYFGFISPTELFFTPALHSHVQYNHFYLPISRLGCFLFIEVIRIIFRISQEKSFTHFFCKNIYFLLSLNILKVFYFETKMILELFLRDKRCKLT